MNFKYEEIKINELIETLDLIQRVFDEFESPYYSKEGTENFYKFANYDTLKTMLQENLKMIVCKDKDKIIGVIAYRYLSHISMLFVDKEYHKQGIATNLFENMKEDCKKNNKTLEKITVKSSPYAIGFYHKIGFIDTNLEQEEDGIKYTPMEIMIKEFQTDELELVFPKREHEEQVEEYL